MLKKLLIAAACSVSLIGLVVLAESTLTNRCRCGGVMRDHELKDGPTRLSNGDPVSLHYLQCNKCGRISR